MAVIRIEDLIVEAKCLLQSGRTSEQACWGVIRRWAKSNNKSSSLVLIQVDVAKRVSRQDGDLLKPPDGILDRDCFE